MNTARPKRLLNLSLSSNIVKIYKLSCSGAKFALAARLQWFLKKSGWKLTKNVHLYFPRPKSTSTVKNKHFSKSPHWFIKGTFSQFHYICGMPNVLTESQSHRLQYLVDLEGQSLYWTPQKCWVVETFVVTCGELYFGGGVSAL